MAYIPSTAEIRKNMEYRQASKNQGLRDMFAAAALTGLCAHGVHVERGVSREAVTEATARAAYTLADAMLSEREAHP